MMGQFEAAALYSEQAEDLLPADAPPEIRLPLTALLSSLALIQQDIPTAIQLSQEILDSTDLKDDFVRGMALNNLAQGTMMIGDIPSATAYYREIVRLSQISGQSPTTISASAQLATLLHQGGKRRAAMSVCQQALQQCVDTRGRTLPLAGYVHIPLGMLYFEGNDIDLARQHLLKGMEYGKQLGLVTGVTTYGGVALAQLLQASGKKDAALKTIAKIRQLASQFNLEHVNRMASGIEADIMIKQGNLQAAASWAEAAGLSPSDTPAPFQEGEYLTYGRVLLASSRLDEAEVLLANFERIALEAGLQRSLITIYILQALTQQSMGRGKDALAPLGKALHLAAPEDYRRAFLDEGQAVIDLLPKIRPLEPAFVDQLLEDVQAEPGLVVPSPRVQPLIEPLSERELEILQLVADGLSNQEIAARLVLSVGTIKAHLHNIYGKLEVRGRTQAIARAREIDLI
jgi:LuxR family maltose regulon positive regulatory protein